MSEQRDAISELARTKLPAAFRENFHIFRLDARGNQPNLPPEEVRVILTGARVTKRLKDGRIDFKGVKRTDEMQVVVTLAEYRAALAGHSA